MTPSRTLRIFLVSVTVSLMFISINGMDCVNNSDCDNEGTCDANGKCDCTTSYTGPNCGSPTSCVFNECVNGATCVPDGMEYTCTCRPAHKGIFCEFLADFTSCMPNPNPCENGVCVDEGNNNVYCDCTPFTDGAFCERTPNCDNKNPCRNGGTCMNGATVDDPSSCVCGSAWRGDICQLPTTCDSSPCQNGGTCIPSEGSVTCDCAAMWEGPTCEAPITTCSTGGCFNGGTCANGMCQCTEFYTGEFCEDESACFDRPCRNGGSCVSIPSSSTSAPTSTPGSYYCECPSGYSGENCTMITPCIPNPCLNSGVCTPQNGMPSYTCECASGFTGRECENTQNPPMNNALSQTTIGIIAGSVAAVVIVIIIIIAIACCCCRKKRDDDKEGLTGLEMGANQRGRHHNYVPSPTKTLMPAIPNLRVSTMRDETKMEFPRNRLTLLNKLGSGSFADVYKAEALGIITKEQKTIVAVKRLKDTATENDKSDLSKELSLYMYLDPHPNIVNILGCCTDADPWYIIMEYLPNNNLQGYLRQIRTGESMTADYRNVKKQKDIPPNDLLTFGVQIARGMEYLASRQCIHRDLAARNILLGEGYVCKVSDFGLARDLEDGQTYEMKSQGRVPVRWMSPESLLHNTYTSQSDVWSFAILIWEIVTLGSHPYPGMSSKQVVKEISAGYRLPKPEHCSQDIYNLMKECWAYEAEERPTFSQVKVRLENMLADAQGYLVMSDFNDDNYLYLEPDAHTGDELDNEGFSHLE